MLETLADNRDLQANLDEAKQMLAHWQSVSVKPEWHFFVLVLRPAYPTADEAPIYLTDA